MMKGDDMTDTKQTMRDTLRQHGLPEAWAEWVREIRINAEGPERIRHNVYRPEPPERAFTDYDDEGMAIDSEHTDEEMAELWADYAVAARRWREKYGSADLARVSVNTGGPTHYTALVTGNGATVKLSGGSDAGPWRVESTETIGGPRCIPVNPGEWNTVLKEAVAASEHDYVPGFVAECTFADGKPREPARKPPCYIAGPFRGKSHWDIAQNIRRAEAVALAAWRSGLFSWVYCPHANTAPDEVWIEGHLEAMRAVHREGGVVVVMNGWDKSSGTRAELAEAHRIGMPVFRYQGDDTDQTAGVKCARRMNRLLTIGGVGLWDFTNDEATLADYLTERAGRGER